MLIRTACEADREAIAEVQTESWKDTYAKELPASYREHRLGVDHARHWATVVMEESDVVLVAETSQRPTGARIDGFIAVWCRPEPFIDNLHVRPSCRSQGLGGALMRDAVRRLVQAGHKSAYLWVVASNSDAIRFYQRLGGVESARADKDLFEHPAPHIKMTWTDLSVPGLQERAPQPDN
jgi:ribosomal protein S18 acetylase RimI-like enzyme